MLKFDPVRWLDVHPAVKTASMEIPGVHDSHMVKVRWCPDISGERESEIRAELACIWAYMDAEALREWLRSTSVQIRRELKLEEPHDAWTV